MDTDASSVNFFSFWGFPCACLAELFSKTAVVKRAAVMALTWAQDDKFERGYLQLTRSFTPRNDKVWISPYNITTNNIKQLGDSE